MIGFIGGRRNGNGVGIGAFGRARRGAGLDGDEGEAGELAGFAILEDFELIGREIGNDFAGFIGDDGVDLDEVDGDADEGSVGIGLLLGAGGEGDGGGTDQDRRGNCFHGDVPMLYFFSIPLA